jgi:putative flippase GtrA
MGFSPSSLIAYVGAEETRKKLRYAGVSVVFVPIGQGLIQALGLLLDDYTAALLLASAIVAFPLFFANKHFVWRITSADNLRTQMLVFWVTAMLGLAVAAMFTYLAENMLVGQSALVRGAVVLIAQLLGIAIAWVGRFVVLDRWLFKLPADTHDPIGATEAQGLP